MIFNSQGLPRPNGATDFEDSSMLAGILHVFGHAVKPDLSHYCKPNNAGYWRNGESKYKMSRDQTVCLFAGMAFNNLQTLVDPDYDTEGDFVSPSVRGHFRRCAGFKATWLQDMALWADLWYSAKYKPREELNQLFCIMMCADVKFMKWYCKANPVWDLAVIEYWAGWRNEPEIANIMVNVISSRIL